MMAKPMPGPIATLTELWRYPVKGMRGEFVPSLDLDANGVAGDRRFAVRSSGAPPGKPLLTGAERAAMLLYSASGQGEETQVTTPGGDVFAIHDPRLLEHLQSALPGGHALSILKSEKPLTDVRPIALLGTGTIAQLAQELATPVDARRFRANIVLQIADGFAEDELVGQRLRLGSAAMLYITERDPRCRIVTLDPETAAPDPALMKHLDRRHEGRVGVYATVITTGTLRVGDAVRVT
jgi:uncharacterized protein YcbX